MSGQLAEGKVTLSLRERVLAMRDRLTANPGFRAWAARFPLTRPIARRRARELFDLNAGFVYSQILSACVRLDLFEALRAGPRLPAQLAPRLGLSPEAALRLLEAAAALRLVAKRGGGRFGLGELGAALLDNPGVTEMVRHHALLYADLADPVALLRRERGGTRLAAYWAYAGNTGATALEGEKIADYSALMAASQPMIAEEVLGAIDLRRHRVLLDVGGGEGAFLIAAAARAPSLRLMLFDLPAVAERGRARLAAAGLAARAEVFGGSFHEDALPLGADILSFVRVLHDHDDDAVLDMLRRAHAALPAGGQLLVAEPMSGTPGAEPVGEAYFGFYLLAMGRGRPRTAEENGALIAAAGFRSWKRLPTRTPLLASVILAER
jgi:demethylspheroidene O-methyltransferase